MELSAAYDLLTSNNHDLGRFYGPADDVDLGAGLILRDVDFPTYDVAQSDYVVGQGIVYVLTHECDIDQENDRAFNDHGVICPIIPLESVLEKFLSGFDPEVMTSFLDAVGKRAVERVIFVPAIPEDLPYGGFLYFGQICSTHVTELTKEVVKKSAAVSLYGLRAIDLALEQALRKPKSQSLPLSSRGRD